MNSADCILKLYLNKEYLTDEDCFYFYNGINTTKFIPMQRIEDMGKFFVYKTVAMQTNIFEKEMMQSRQTFIFRT